MVTIPIIPAFGRLRKKDHEFENSPGYIVRLCLKNQSSNQSWTSYIKEYKEEEKEASEVEEGGKLEIRGRTWWWFPWVFFLFPILDLDPRKAATQKYQWCTPTKACFLYPKNHQRGSQQGRLLAEKNHSTLAKQHRNLAPPIVGGAQVPSSTSLWWGVHCSPPAKRRPSGDNDFHLRCAVTWPFSLP